MATTYTLKVTAYSLNVRKSPTVNSQAFAWLQNGNVVTASKVQNGWYYIDSKGGWVSGKYVAVQKTTTTPTPTPPASVDTSPPKTNATTTTKPVTNTTTSVETNSSKSYVVDTKSSAGDSLDSFEASAKTSSGVEIHDNVYIGVNSKAQNITSPQQVYSGGAYYVNTQGFSTFADSTGFAVNLDSDFTGMSTALNAARRQLNIFQASDNKKLFTHFNRYKIAMPGAELHKAYPYIFFTRPEIALADHTTGRLNEDIANVHNVFKYIYNDNPSNIKSLGKSLSTDHDFNVLLSNMARSFEPSDEVIRTVEDGETYTGWKMVYARNTNESNTAGQFNIQYRDNRNYDIFKMHKAWIEYMNLAYRGAIKMDRKLIHKKILDYVCSVYYFVCAEDGETILFWTKYFGVFPINTPASASGWAAGSPNGLPEFTIAYMYAMKEDYDPLTFAEFNLLSSGDLKYKKSYNSANIMSSASLSGAPYVDRIKQNDGRIVFKLRFRP